VLTRQSFRSDAEWERVVAAHGTPADRIELLHRFQFEPVKIIPQDWRRELLQPVIGSQDPALQALVNATLPVQVFNLSITPPHIIEETHAHMARVYHPGGGPWQRSYMPRTTFVFINEQPGLSASERRTRARDEARAVLSAYWQAMEGTIEAKKVAEAADNALVGTAADIAEQIGQRFHADDRLMLWFDFFNHDNARVVANMSAFMHQVAPLVNRT
jgi:hypothetical protein